MTLLLTLVITLTVPSPSDAAYIAALACGESCGTPRQAQELVIANILYDHAEHGRGWLRTRWYAPLKPNAKVEALVWSVVERLRNRQWPRCALLGSIGDEIYWKANGYLPADAVPDFAWDAGSMGVRVFGCWYPVVVFAPTECTGELCPQ